MGEGLDVDLGWDWTDVAWRVGCGKGARDVWEKVLDVPFGWPLGWLSPASVKCVPRSVVSCSWKDAIVAAVVRYCTVFAS